MCVIHALPNFWMHNTHRLSCLFIKQNVRYHSDYHQCTSLTFFVHHCIVRSISVFFITPKSIQRFNRDCTLIWRTPFSCVPDPKYLNRISTGNFDLCSLIFNNDAIVSKNSHILFIHLDEDNIVKTGNKNRELCRPTWQTINIHKYLCLEFVSVN